MAVETALKFLERLEREETLRTQLYVSRPKDLAQFVQFAHGKGFVVEQQDMVEALKSYEEQFASGSLAPLKQYLETAPKLTEKASSDS